METFKVVLEFTDEAVANLLCSALEGGSHYWCRIVSYRAPHPDKRISPLGDPFRHLDYPLSEGGSIALQDTETREQYNLDRQVISTGLQVMAIKFPKHFADWTSENYDSETGDVFLQCCLFEDVIYG